MIDSHAEKPAELRDALGVQEKGARGGFAGVKDSGPGARPILLGGLTFDFPVCLAPMAGFSDSVFRCICRAFGADTVTTEMISAKGLAYANARTEALLNIAPGEGPVAVQLFGHEPALLADAARRVSDTLGGALLAIDLNMGCPAQKIVGGGDGSALMNKPALAGQIVEAVAKAAPVPVTVKFRKGWDDAHDNAVEFAKMCESSGAAAIAVHPRTRAALYAGRADWAALRRVKQAVRIPVIGNGDVTTGVDALAMRAQTGVDGVMIGRGALGNPFIFEEIHAVLSGLPYEPPTQAQRRALALEHAARALAQNGPHALVELRKHIAWYIRGLPGSAKLRARINACTSLDELRQILT